MRWQCGDGARGSSNKKKLFIITSLLPSTVVFADSPPHGPPTEPVPEPSAYVAWLVIGLVGVLDVGARRAKREQRGKGEEGV